MKNTTSAKIILIIAFFASLYHLLILVGVIPYQYTWGGQLQSYAQMIQFEVVSLSINAIIACIVSMKVGFIKQYIQKKYITIILWLFIVLFLLNTLGNIFAVHSIETYIFTPLTLLTAYLFFRLVNSVDG